MKDIISISTSTMLRATPMFEVVIIIKLTRQIFACRYLQCGSNPNNLLDDLWIYFIRRCVSDAHQGRSHSS